MPLPGWHRILGVAILLVPLLLPLLAWAGWTGSDKGLDVQRVVFSLTTIGKRIKKVKPVIDQIVEGQTRVPDAVYLAVPPGVKVPKWLKKYNETTSRPGVLKVLHMEEDYGPASKLLAALAEGGERSPGTLIVYGDDDVLYGDTIVEQHVKAQRKTRAPSAFGSRQIGLGQGKKRENLLEATGTISVPASAVPHEVFRVKDMPPACRLSDDYWISHNLVKAGVKLENLPKCQYDFGRNSWPRSCGTPFHTVKDIQHIEALSETVLDRDGNEAHRSGGDWRAQLKRYEACQKLLRARTDL